MPVTLAERDRKLTDTTMPNPWTGKGNPYTRKEVRDRLMSTIKKGDAIIAGGAGTGISAKFIEKGGADLIIIYNSGRFDGSVGPRTFFNPDRPCPIPGPEKETPTPAKKFATV